MDDQQKLWDELHTNGVMDELRHQPSEYVQSVIAKLPRSAKILELGCGTAGDARFLQDHGHDVVATDFSEPVITRNSEIFPDMKFQVLNMAVGLPFDNQSFNVVYANLSLHYFDDRTTKNIFLDIRRILKRKGILIFRCKSINSQSEKEDAREVAPDIYVQNGHLRHLFSVEYVQELFKECGLLLIEDKYTQGLAYGKNAHFVEAIGEKV